jgi:hypothetical protein
MSTESANLILCSRIGNVNSGYTHEYPAHPQFLEWPIFRGEHGEPLVIRTNRNGPPSLEIDPIYEPSDGS